MDTLSSGERSRRMALIRGRNTEPELQVRKLVRALGIRFVIHAADLPGKPDLVFRKRRKVVFVHGCFWHRHVNCADARWPKSRLEFWRPKLEANRRRDARVQRRLRAAGWSVMIVWTCRLRRPEIVAGRLRRFLERG